MEQVTFDTLKEAATDVTLIETDLRQIKTNVVNVKNSFSNYITSEISSTVGKIDALNGKFDSNIQALNTSASAFTEFEESPKELSFLEQLFNIYITMEQDKSEALIQVGETISATAGAIILTTAEGVVKSFENLSDAISFLQSKYANTDEQLTVLCGDIRSRFWQTYTPEQINNFNGKSTVSKTDLDQFLGPILDQLGIDEDQRAGFFKNRTAEEEAAFKATTVDSPYSTASDMTYDDIETVLLYVMNGEMNNFANMQRDSGMTKKPCTTMMTAEQIEAFKADLKDIARNSTKELFDDKIYNQKLPFDNSMTYGEYLEQESLVQRNSFVGNCFQSFGNMLPTIAMSLVPGAGQVLSGTALWMNSFGAAAERGLGQVMTADPDKFEKNPEKAWGEVGAYSGIEATAELIIERLGTGIAGFKVGKGTKIDQLLGDFGSYLSSLPANKATKQLVATMSKVITSMVNEGGEEVLSNLFEPIALKLSIMSDKDIGDLFKENVSIESLATSFLSGAFTTLIMQGVNMKSVNLEAQTELEVQEIYDSLPEPVKSTLAKSDARVVDLYLQGKLTNGIDITDLTDLNAIQRRIITTSPIYQNALSSSTLQNLLIQQLNNSNPNITDVKTLNENLPNMQGTPDAERAQFIANNVPSAIQNNKVLSSYIDEFMKARAKVGNINPELVKLVDRAFVTGYIKPFFHSFEEHNYVHITRVGEASYNEAVLLNQLIQKGKLPKGYGKVSPELLRLAGIVHDLGMRDQGYQLIRTFEKSDTGVEVEKSELAPLVDENGFAIRTWHPFNSAVTILQNRAIFGKDTEMLAVLAYLHSKSSSGVKSEQLVNSAYISNVVRILSENNTVNGQEVFSFNIGNLVQMKDGQPIFEDSTIKVEPKKHDVHTVKSKNYQFKGDTLGQIITGALALRMGDAHATKTGISHGGGIIEASKYPSIEDTLERLKDIATTDVDVEALAQTEAEASDVTIDLLGEKQVLKDSPEDIISKRYIIGEQNAEVMKDTIDSDTLVHTVQVKTELAPASTWLHGVVDKCGEYSKDIIQDIIVILPEDTAETVRIFYQDQAAHFNNGSTNITIKIK